MRHLAFLSGLLAVAGLGSSRDFENGMRAIEAAPDFAPVRGRKRTAPAGWGYGQRHFPRPSRIQRHTGAGGAGAHRAWKKRRASGRA